MTNKAIPVIRHFFDPKTFSLTYLVSDPVSKQAVIIDPVLDFDPAAMRTTTTLAKKLLAAIDSDGLDLRWILETHAHADHLTSAHWLKTQTGAKVVVGEHIDKVQQVFNRLYELDGEQAANTADFDQLVCDGDELDLGELKIRVLHTPGHTPSCCTYLIGENAFVGDTLFMPDYGTARCDFPGGDARELYHSIQRILALPDNTQLYMCHDYQPGGRELQWQTTVKNQRESNIHIHQGISESQFVQLRQSRDQTLSLPKLIMPALQINIRAGKFPQKTAQGNQFIKLPLNRF